MEREGSECAWKGNTFRFTMGCFRTGQFSSVWVGSVQVSLAWLSPVQCISFHFTSFHGDNKVGGYLRKVHRS